MSLHPPVSLQRRAAPHPARVAHHLQSPLAPYRVRWPRPHAGPCQQGSWELQLGLTRAVALDYGLDKIRVNTIVPGAIDMPLSRRNALEAGIAEADIEAS